jgi:hypothetical protein
MGRVCPQKLFRLPRRLKQSLTVSQRDNAVPFTVNHHYGDRADVGNELVALVFIGNGPAQGDLEWPGEPEVAEFFPGYGAETGESAVQDDAIQRWLLVAFYPFAGKRCPQRAAQALAEKEQRLAFYLLFFRQPPKAGLCVVQGAFYVGCAG